jgi:iron complex transport system ATP-binding protein
VSSLETRGLRLAYGEREALKGIDLRIERGARMALIGPNGAGKSSLLRCLAGAQAAGDGVQSGQVLLDGVPFMELSRDAIARQVAAVAQQASLPFAMRVEELVLLGRIPHEHPLVGPAAADLAAAAAAIRRVGVEALVGRDARQLSMGERQLVFLAMALAQSASLLVLDEPTVHLDLRHQVAIMELLRDLNEREGTTVVAVLHDISLAAHFFPRLVLLDAGAVVADGPPEEVLTPGRIRSVFGVDPALVRVGHGAPAA